MRSQISPGTKLLLRKTRASAAETGYKQALDGVKEWCELSLAATPNELVLHEVIAEIERLRKECGAV